MDVLPTVWWSRRVSFEFEFEQDKSRAAKPRELRAPASGDCANHLVYAPRIQSDKRSSDWPRGFKPVSFCRLLTPLRPGSASLTQPLLGSAPITQGHMPIASQ
jgi:hypothetical protein